MSCVVFAISQKQEVKEFGKASGEGFAKAGGGRVASLARFETLHSWSGVENMNLRLVGIAGLGLAMNLTSQNFALKTEQLDAATNLTP